MRTILTGCMALLSMGAMADGGQPIKIDASKVQRITFKEDQVTLKYNDGTPDTTFDMGMLVLEFGNTTGLKERTTMVRKARLEGKKVYRLDGRYVGRDAARLKKGTYVIEGRKVIVK